MKKENKVVVVNQLLLSCISHHEFTIGDYELLNSSVSHSSYSNSWLLIGEVFTQPI